MKFKFIFKNEDEWKELKNIVKAEAVKAFPPEAIYRFCENYASHNGPAVYSVLRKSTSSLVRYM